MVSNEYMAAEKVRLGPQNWRPELRIGPTSTARRDEYVGENDDFCKMAERVQGLTRWQLPSAKSSARLPTYSPLAVLKFQCGPRAVQRSLPGHVGLRGILREGTREI